MHEPRKVTFFRGQRIVGLHKASLETHFAELLLADAPGEKAAVISTFVEFDPVSTLKSPLVELYGYRVLRPENATASVDPCQDGRRPYGARVS
jgi:hypothetical protein